MSIATLSKRWMTAKSMKRELEAEMLEIEQELLGLVESTEGGSKKNHADGYAITVKRPINRTLDRKVWDAIKESIPRDLWPIKIKEELDDSGCSWLAENNPFIWNKLAACITEKPGKPSFTIESEEE